MSIVLKADQRTEKHTEGVVARLLTNSSTHPHGIKVMLHAKPKRQYKGIECTDREKL